MPLSTRDPMASTLPSTSYESAAVVTVDPIVEELTLEEILHDAPDAPQTVALVEFLRDIWRVNRDHKQTQGITDQMLKNLRARNAEYEPEVEQAIRAIGHPVVYAGITGVKCRAGEAWIHDVYSSRENSWGLQPTPDPEYSESIKAQLSEEILQRLNPQAIEGADAAALLAETEQEAAAELEKELDIRAEKMTRKIRDQFAEGRFDEAFRQVVSDLVTFKAGIMKGPITRIRRRKSWVTNPETDEVIEEVRVVAVPEYERVSPLDLYPSPNATSPDEGSLVEVVKIPRHQLLDLKNQPGYDADAIDRVLEKFSAVRGQVEVTEELSEEREDQEKRDFDEGSHFAEDLDGLEFHVRIQGKMLNNAGVTKLNKKKVEDLAEYDINTILIGDEIIYKECNDDPTGTRPYHVTGWEKEVGSFWYKGVPELMSDLQRMCNGATRALAYNMGIASGPQVLIDTSMMLPGEDFKTLTPGKLWQYNGKGNPGNRAPVSFEQPDSRAQELMAVYDQYSRLADDYTQIPAYTDGNASVTGAGRTFGGLSALMSNAARGMKRVMGDIHTDIFARVVRRQFDWNMRYEDTDYKGDVTIIPIGIVALMVKEQLTERRIQLLQSVANDFGVDIIGFSGRVRMVREIAEALEMTDIVPDDAELRDMQEKRDQEQQAQNQAAIQAQQLEMARQQAEVQKLQADAQVAVLKAQLAQAETQIKAATEQRHREVEEVNLQIKAALAEAKAAKDIATATKMGMDSLLDAHERSSKPNEKDTKGSK